MIHGEIRKVLHSIRWVIFIFVLLYPVSLFIHQNPYDDETIYYYREYMERFQGKIDVLKEEEIWEEYKAVYTVKEMNNRCRMAGQPVDVEAEIYADHHWKAFELLYEKYNRLKNMEEKERYFFYDLPWKVFFQQTENNLFEIFLVVVISVYMITMEFRDDRLMMLRSTVKGKRGVIYSKQFGLILIAGGISLLFSFLDTIIILIREGFGELSLPLKCILDETELRISPSVVQYIFLRSMYHILWIVVLAVVSMAVGMLIRQFSLGIFVVISLLALPLLMEQLFPFWLRSCMISFQIAKNSSISQFGWGGVLSAAGIGSFCFIFNNICWSQSEKKCGY